MRMVDMSWEDKGRHGPSLYLSTSGLTQLRVWPMGLGSFFIRHKLLFRSSILV